MKKCLLILGFLLLVTGCGNTSLKENGSTVTCNEMKSYVNDGAILIDVREDYEYNSKHLDGAINISVNSISSIQDRDDINKDSVIIVYCASGKRSNNAKDTLISLGYNHVYDLGSINNCN